ncbi:hypothetical protein B9Z55_004407 [Caenorhabditis nigoni]|uniref:Uncharacterized protein n=1 Tax=Caenorhabditis nigoni TaxID=1611254 RepID=A0A2G5UWC8_9PELO|nr:hypothetical protein B9Z55_004407 [Caenorhabditis nigoni]
MKKRSATFSKSFNRISTLVIIKGKEIEFIQLLIDKSDGKLRMYGSAEELLENINIYEDFPENFLFFDTLSSKFDQNREKCRNFWKFQSCATTTTHLFKTTINYALYNFCFELITQNDNLSSEFKGNLKGKERELIQLLFDKSNNKLRMYGSAEELLENINIYGSSPGPFMHNSEVEEPYQTRPIIYKSLKSEEYIGKSDDFTRKYRRMCGICETIIDENLEPFLPRGRQPITGRVFEDGDQQFSMKSEVSGLKKKHR